MAARRAEPDPGWNANEDDGVGGGSLPSIVRLEGVVKAFAGTEVLRGIDSTASRRVNAILGEKGAASRR